MAAALTEAIRLATRTEFSNEELRRPSAPVTGIVPAHLRRVADYSFRRRGATLAKVLQDRGQLRHVHCYGHLIAVPSVIRHKGASYSVTLDSTEILNTREFPASTRHWGRNGIRRRIEAERELLRGAEFVCCTSEWARKGVLADYELDERAVHTNPFPAAGVASLQRPDATWLTFVGNNIRRKGGDRLVEWHQTKLRGLAELHIVSIDPLAAAFADLPGVVVHGGLSNSAVRREILPNTRLLALPTSYDQSPIALTEAAAAGVPAVASHMAGIPELVVDGMSGYTVACRDDDGFVARIEQLLTNDELTGRMGSAARQHYLGHLQAEQSIDRLFKLVDKELCS